ncbi:hypothetical protein RclHR1_01210020 [Rhizophagus clarus]|uniref:Uncharacterized protein n=1 Tax=Rhizophagus clarus TaxID=94130 RepID=A0A2Z6QAW8_9GLOM|nr:hypothetical protein RclHR1_01210020 [Rhizophagus clarus]
MEKELYSKACVASSIKFAVSEATENDANLTESDRISRNLATILARDKEVVAVYLKILPEKCKAYISKNDVWREEDDEYISKIQNCLKNMSENPVKKLEEAWKREDVRTLFTEAMTYCSAKLDSRFKKLKQDIIKDKHDSHIKSFIEQAKIDVENINEVNKQKLSRCCCEYYKKIKNDITIPEKFKRHIRKVGSYVGSLIDITKCAINAKNKILFSNMELYKLNPIIINQPIFSWKRIIQEFIPDPDDYKVYEEICLDKDLIKKRLDFIYDGRSDIEDIEQRIYLHAELNILTNIINQEDKSRVFIAVSKRCCYLCELYIEFAKLKGYNIVTPGSHKKIYHKWKLPDVTNVDFRNESMSHILASLNQIIENEIAQYTSELARSDSDGHSINSDDNDFQNIDDMFDDIF